MAMGFAAAAAVPNQNDNDPNALPPTTSAMPDGGMVVDFNPPQPNAPQLGFADDLTPLFTSGELARLGNDLVTKVEEDERTRKDWAETYARGLNLLGLKYEQRTMPWQDACGAFHPMLLESVIRFQAQAMTDTFPAAGPVRTKVIGKLTDEKQWQADRIERDMNWQATEVIAGYRDETEMMLFNLPLAGCTFRKFYYDERHKRPVAEYVLPEHIVMPYHAGSLDSTPRFAHILIKTQDWLRTKQRQGFYRDVKVSPTMPVVTEITEEKDRIEGRTNTNTSDNQMLRIYEVHLEEELLDQRDNPVDPLVTDGFPSPYIITVDKGSAQVLSIRRNWREQDPTRERIKSVVQHKYMPGFGAYGMGLINILGGLTESATSLIRQLVDAGTLANLPAGFKAKTLRIKDDSTPIAPAEFRDVDAGGGNLKDSFMLLPYKEPSQVLAALLANIVDEGRRIGSVADMKISDMTAQNMPVGTTMAILERTMKVMSAVQARLHHSMKNEFRVLAAIIRDFMGNIPYPFELEEHDVGATRAQDYDDRVDVIPVSDPNATTMAMRIMQQQAVIQLAQTFPQNFDLPTTLRAMIRTLGSEDEDRFVPPPADTQPADPVTENMNLMTGKPVVAGPDQDHDAHIKVHMDALNDPKLGAAMASNPQLPSILAAAAAHVQEHIAFQYRDEIQKQLGVPLPPPGQPLPPDVEYNLSRVIAAAADKLLGKDQAEQATLDIMQQLQDPVLQNQQRQTDIEQQKADDKRDQGVMQNALAQKKIETSLLETLIREEAETIRSALVAEGMQKTSLDDKEAEMAGHMASVTGAAIDGIATIEAAKHTAKAKNAP